MTPTQATIDAIERMQPCSAYVEHDDQGRPRVVRLEADWGRAPGESIAAAITRTIGERSASAEALDRCQGVVADVLATKGETERARARIATAAACGGISDEQAAALYREQSDLERGARDRIRPALLDLIRSVEGRR